MPIHCEHFCLTLTALVHAKLVAPTLDRQGFYPLSFCIPSDFSLDSIIINITISPPRDTMTYLMNALPIIEFFNFSA